MGASSGGSDGSVSMHHPRGVSASPAELVRNSRIQLLDCCILCLGIARDPFGKVVIDGNFDFHLFPRLTPTDHGFFGLI